MIVTTPMVLGAAVLYVVVIGLIYRFFDWIARRRRAKEARALEQIRPSPRNVEKAHPLAPQTSPQSAPKPVTVGSPKAPLSLSKRSVAGTLPPGAVARSASPPPPKPFTHSVALPAGVQAAKIVSTLQPAGASWTAPPVKMPPPEARAAPPPPVTPPPAGPLVVYKPSVAGTLAAPATQSSQRPAPGVASSSRPNTAATLAPGTALRPAQPPPPKPFTSVVELPANAQPPRWETTLQPVGARWTAPPVSMPAPEPPKPVVASFTPPPVGPLTLSRPSVDATREPRAAADRITISFAGPTPIAAAKMAAPPLTPARSLSSGAVAATPTFRLTPSRPAPTPAPAPPAWAVAAPKSSLPVRIRRPDTLLVGKTAKEVVLISAARKATRVLGRAYTSLIEALSRRTH